MKGTMLIFSADNPKPVVHEFNRKVKLEELQKAVDGYLEVVPYFNTILHNGETHRCVVFCNEEGKLKGMPVNQAATYLWWTACQHRVEDHLVGPIAAVFGDSEFMRTL